MQRSTNMHMRIWLSTSAQHGPSLCRRRDHANPGPILAATPRRSASQTLQWLDVSTNTMSAHVPAGLCDNNTLTKLILFNIVVIGPILQGSARSFVSGPCACTVTAQRHGANGARAATYRRCSAYVELAGNELSNEFPDDRIQSL
jgi:hypothetical protein